MQSTTVFYNYIIPCDDGDDDSDDENGDDDNLDTLSLCIYYFSFSFFQQKKEDFFGKERYFCVCCAVCTEICFVIVACTKDYFLLPKKHGYCAVCMYLCSFFIHLWWLVRIKWDEKELCGRETFLGLFCVFLL